MSRRWSVKHYGQVLFVEPDIQSRAALVLLTVDLRKQDDTIFNPWKWMAFKDQYLRSVIAEHGAIHCHYCNLKLQYVKKKCKNQATLDHVLPISKGGKIYDPSNLVPACRKCNNNKSDTVLTIELA
jgi:5-methylcytosine-specific restriction endonuclease McrA